MIRKIAPRNGHRLMLGLSALLWFGLLLAPPLMAEEAWQEIDHPELDLLFADLSAEPRVYGEVSIDPVSVWYPDTDVTGAERAETLRADTLAVFTDAMAEQGLELVKTSTAGSLALHIELIDLSATPVAADVLEWASQFRFRVQPGRVTLVAELRDSDSGRVIMRLADLGDEPAGASIANSLSAWGTAVAQNIVHTPDTTLHLASR